MIDAPALLYVGSGFVVGLLVGVTGVGGGSLMTPLLMLGFGVHPAAAVGTDLMYAAATKSAGTVLRGVDRAVAWRIMATLALGSVPATGLALLVLSRFDLHGAGVARLISLALGVVLLLSAASLLLRARLAVWAGGWLARAPRRTAGLTVLTGGLLGVLVSVCSIGAGALGLTVLVLLYPREPINRLVGADIAHAVPLTLLAGIGHWLLGDVRWALFGLLLAGSLPGVCLGCLVASRVPERLLRRLLAVILMLIGAHMTATGLP